MVKMNYSREKLLFDTVERDNILPLTSRCSLNCIFCSHKNNPPEVKTHAFGDLELDLIKQLAEFINPQKPLFIGESATRIIEGEPFLHPKINKILDLLHKKWPDLNLRITTNGSHIGDNELSHLKKFDNLELNISVNGPDAEARKFLMNDQNAENVFTLLPKLQKLGILFQVSIVSMHHITGLGFIKRTMDRMELYQPDSLRIFLPGFSKYAANNFIFKDNIYDELKDFVDQISEDYSYPIIVEPQIISSLDAEILGIINKSPAFLAEIKKGDIIEEVNGEKSESRVDAFHKIKKSKNPNLTVKRNSKIINMQIIKEREERSGLIMSYDITPFLKEKFLGYLEQSKNIKTVIITSELAFPLLKYLVDNNCKDNYKFRLIKAKNEFFGGSIMSAGLLLNSDIISAVENLDFSFERIILPEIIYDYYGYDLSMCSYTMLEEKLNSEIILL
ncbi:MAG: DUF512 domain-containing protein [Bacillota bacterium]